METPAQSKPAAGAVPILRAWDDPNVCHGFVGRRGGVSRGPFASMNLSYWTGDDDRAVDANWERLRRQTLMLKAVASLNQVHGNVVHAVTRETAKLRPAGDGMAAAEPGVALGIFTADCVPVLMIDPKRKIAGALHAGWRGAIADIASAGVHAMVLLGAQPSEISAALGPSIGPCCFEVDAALAEQFVREVAGAQRHCSARRPGKAYLDLRGIVGDQLERAGVARDRILEAGPCTRCAADRFFSRRAAGGGVTGLQLSFVGFAG